MQRPSYQSVLERDGQNSKTERRSTRLHSNSGSMPPSRQPIGPMGPGTDQRHIQEQSFLSEIIRIPSNLVAQLKQELGLGGKDPTAMTFDEKRRLVEAHRQQTQSNSSSSNTAMTSDERHRKRARGNPSSSNGPPPAPPDISEPPFTFEFIRSVANTMDKFDPSTHLPPVNCCPICGALNRSCLPGHFSPSSNGASSAGPDMSAALFTPDFIQAVANSLDEFDPSFLRPDGDINFERDFGQWFNHPDDVGGSLDLK